MHGVEVDALEAQSKELEALLGELADDDWDRPTRCPGWRVKEIAAHCEAMMRRLIEYASQSVEGPPEIDRAGYYGYDPEGPREGEDPSKTFSEVIRERVIEEVGGRSGPQIRDDLSEALRAMLEGLAEVPDDAVTKVIVRPGHPKIELKEFVATRVLELGVHTMDIGHAALLGERVHPEAVPVIAGILRARLGKELPKGLGWDDRTLILTGTGRRPLVPNERFVLGDLAGRFPLLA